MMTITNRFKQIYGGMGQANVAALLRQMREQQVIIYAPKATFNALKQGGDAVLRGNEEESQS